MRRAGSLQGTPSFCWCRTIGLALQTGPTEPSYSNNNNLMLQFDIMSLENHCLSDEILSFTTHQLVDNQSVTKSSPHPSEDPAGTETG
jgi:hypothetical protein